MDVKKYGSGILPIATNTKRMCLTWRSSEVTQGDCWGVVGGNLQNGKTLEESAIEELGEELGYRGDIQMHKAYQNRTGNFEYHTFIGIVPMEFKYNPEPDFAWETDFIAWLEYGHIRYMLKKNEKDFHPGFVKFLKDKNDMIESFL